MTERCCQNRRTRNRVKHDGKSNEQIPGNRARSCPSSVLRPYTAGRRDRAYRIGVGSFHRVHQAPIIDDYLEHTGDLSWCITGIGITATPAAAAKAKAYLAQDCLYSITELVPVTPQPVRVISTIKDYIYSPAEQQKMQLVLEQDATRIVSLTITEGGFGTSGCSGPGSVSVP